MMRPFFLPDRYHPAGIVRKTANTGITEHMHAPNIVCAITKNHRMNPWGVAPLGTSFMIFMTNIYLHIDAPRGIARAKPAIARKIKP